jgi:hypothetical protein
MSKKQVVPTDNGDSIRETRPLRYEFSREEITELAIELANHNQELRRIEEEKKSVVSEYGSKINISKERISSLSDKVSSGYEVRDIECEVRYHEPAKGMKTLTRLDTGFSWKDKMTDYDFNLFTQYQGEEEME